jgi:3-dehydroquinate synthase
VKSVVKNFDNIFIYGPPGSGKTTLAHSLAEQLSMPWIDLDEQIVQGAGMAIPQIFSAEGEAGFRLRETAALRSAAQKSRQVVSLGGGALLDPENRRLAEAAGSVLCLYAPLETLSARIAEDGDTRPLLANAGLADLLERRSAHYASFPRQLDLTHLDMEQAAWQAQVSLGAFQVHGMGAGYDVRAEMGCLVDIGEHLRIRGFNSPLALVSDEHVAGFYAEGVLTSLERAGYPARLVVIPAGEAVKTIQTVNQLWEGFLDAGLERGSTVLALGGGVVGDLAGFAAATFLRGVRWVAIPTTLLAMVDASLGGKTGADLPRGKNLIGAFHPPVLVLADPAVLGSLPEAELLSGLAEVVKHGVIGDPGLFELCSRGLGVVSENLAEIVRRAMAVKIKVIQDDPYERGQRAALNLGHTLGHAVELASDFRLRHGEAVAIGMVAAARLSERLGLAQPGLAQQIESVLLGLGLPSEIPGDLTRSQIIDAMRVDKKRAGGKARLALPVRIGEVKVGIMIEDAELLS